MDKRLEIIRAAQELFRTYGYSKTTMTDIATQLGISKASLYYYFKDKESIFSALVQQELQEFLNRINRIIEEEGKSQSIKLQEYVIKRLEFLQKFLTLSNLNKEYYASAQQFFCMARNSFRLAEKDLIGKILQKGIDVNEFKTIDIEEYSELFLDVLLGLRKNAIIQSENSDSKVIPTDAYEKVKRQNILFTEMFIHSISL